MMKKTISFALAVALAAATHATPPSKAAAVGKTLPNTVPAAQAGTTSVAQTGASNATAPSNMVCPPGIKPQSGSNKCFPRPTKSVQK
jgi:hypothetical protein